MRTSREWLGVLVDRLDMLGDRLLQLDGRAVNPALDPLLRQIGEEPLHPVGPFGIRFGQSRKFELFARS